MWPLTRLALAPHRAEVAFALAARALAERPPHALLKKKDTQHAHILKWFTPLITHATPAAEDGPQTPPVTAKRLASGAGGCDG